MYYYYYYYYPIIPLALDLSPSPRSCAFPRRGRVIQYLGARERAYFPLKSLGSSPARYLTYSQGSITYDPGHVANSASGYFSMFLKLLYIMLNYLSVDWI